MYTIIRIALYAVIGLTLALGGIHAMDDWQYWVVVASVLVIDITSHVDAIESS